MIFFFGRHLILKGKLDVGRRKNLFLVFTDIFSGNGNKKLHPLPPPFSNFWARSCRRSLSFVAIFKKSLFVLLNASAE